MTALIPELAMVTTGVGAVVIRLGLDRGLLQPRNAPPQVSILRPSDRLPRPQALHREHSLIFGIPASALWTIAGWIICMRSEQESGAVVQVVDGLEAWPAENGASSAPRTRGTAPWRWSGAFRS